jgi:hypothetical protein
MPGVNIFQSLWVRFGDIWVFPCFSQWWLSHDLEKNWYSGPVSCHHHSKVTDTSHGSARHVWGVCEHLKSWIMPKPHWIFTMYRYMCYFILIETGQSKLPEFCRQCQPLTQLHKWENELCWMTKCNKKESTFSQLRLLQWFEKRTIT